MCLSPIFLMKQNMYVPCGHCKECLLKSTYDWSHRIMIEAQHHDKNCCVTLTYNDDNLPDDGMLYYRHVQLFLKKLRKDFAPEKVRFFCSGEYGDRYSRPHYHIILFGYYPTDGEYMFQRHGVRYFKSEYLNKLWSHGFATFSAVTEKSAFYCAKYLQKLNFSDMPVKPFVHMSLKPGIGYQAYDSDMVFSSKLYVGGRAFSLPRFYRKMLKRDFPEIYDTEPYKRQIVQSSHDRYAYLSKREVLRRDQINKRFFKKYTLKY